MRVTLFQLIRSFGDELVQLKNDWVFDVTGIVSFAECTDLQILSLQIIDILLYSTC